MCREEGGAPKYSQAVPCLALAKLSEIFYLMVSQTFLLRMKIYEPQMREKVGKARADITRGSKMLI